MNDNIFSPLVQRPEELAGDRYEELIRSSQDARAFAPAPQVRLAAIIVCEDRWRLGADKNVIAACQGIAASSAAEGLQFRVFASRLRAVLNEGRRFLPVPCEPRP